MKEDPTNIRNWVRRPDGITTSGKLTRNDPVRLAEIGIKHVVNLAMADHPESLANEAELMAQCGIIYTHIPVPFDAPTMDHVAKLKTALAKVNGPTHVHCIANFRVTAFFYLLDQEAGMPEPEARLIMQEVWDPLASNDPRTEAWQTLLKP